MEKMWRKNLPIHMERGSFFFIALFNSSSAFNLALFEEEQLQMLNIFEHLLYHLLSILVLLGNGSIKS